VKPPVPPEDRSARAVASGENEPSRGNPRPPKNSCEIKDERRGIPALRRRSRTPEPWDQREINPAL